MFLSSNLAYLRKKNGLTQETLAKEIDIEQSTLANYESGIREPNLEKVIRLSGYFGVSIDELLAKDLRPYNAVFAENIKFLRKKHGFLQSDISKLLGNEPNIEKLINLSEFFGITLDQLLKEDLSKGGSYDK